MKAANGKEFLALKIFSLSLAWFKESVLKDLNSQSEEKLANENIKWVITVPAIWKQPAKSFMREAACQVRKNNLIFESVHSDSDLLKKRP